MDTRLKHGGARKRRGRRRRERCVWVDDSAIALTLPLSARRLLIINVGLMGRWIRADLDQGGKEAQTLIRQVRD